jgi:uncharacterized membrane protein
MVMRLSRLLMGTLYVGAGVLHFVVTRTYERIVPDYLPAHHSLVMISGAAEIAGGIGLLINATQVPAAYGIIALLIAVMPANVWMVQHPERYPGLPLWALYVRLPLQLLLIWWAWQYTKRDIPHHGTTTLSS